MNRRSDRESDGACRPTFESYCTSALGLLLKGDFRSADGDACLAAVTTAAKSKDLCAVPSAFTTACGGVFVGTTKPVTQVKLGETCKGTIEPSGYQTNADRDDVSSGGTVCDGIATYCEPTSMKCAAVRPTGTTCTAIGDEMCGATNHCVYAKGASTCQPLARTGATCAYASDCLGYAPCNGGVCGDVGLGLHSVASLVNGGACYTKL